MVLGRFKKLKHNNRMGGEDKKEAIGDGPREEQCLRLGVNESENRLEGGKKAQIGEAEEERGLMEKKGTG